jgi:hypothetical protein
MTAAAPAKANTPNLRNVINEAYLLLLQAAQLSQADPDVTARLREVAIKADAILEDLRTQPRR